MQRAEDDDDSMAGQDSFIDVICNMVGILIVLVAIMGMRAAQAPEKLFASAIEAALNKPADAAADAPKPHVDFDSAVRKASAAQNDIKTALVQAADLRGNSQLVDAQREELIKARAIVEQQIEARRAKLDAAGQRQFDVQRKISEYEVRLHELTQEQLTLASIPVEVKEVECSPTPIAKKVTEDDDVVYIRIKHGELAVIPNEALLDEWRRHKAGQIQTQVGSTILVSEDKLLFGPIDGFRLRYQAVEITDEQVLNTSITAPLARKSLQQIWIFVPTADHIGENIEQATLPNSMFMQALRAKRAARPIVEAWVYPGNCDALRTLKKALWELAIPLAVRTPQNNQPIGFATDGTPTDAQ